MQKFAQSKLTNIKPPLNGGVSTQNFDKHLSYKQLLIPKEDIYVFKKNLLL